MSTRPSTNHLSAFQIVASLIGVFVVMRVWLHLSPGSNFNVAGYNIHHLFTGIIILVAAAVPLIVSSPKARTRMILNLLFGAGLALVMDEWVYLIATDGSDSSYLLPVSLWGGIILIGLTTVYIYLLSRR